MEASAQSQLNKPSSKAGHSTGPHSESEAPTWKMSFVRNTDHTLSLRYGVYQRDPEKKARLGIVFVNGRTEWLEKYQHLLGDLSYPDDVRWVSWDHRGQGASGGARSYVSDYQDYAEDMSLVLSHALDKETPYVILAHSMGALISAYAVLKNHVQPQALMLCSPFFGLPSWAPPTSVVKLLTGGMSRIGLGPVGVYAEEKEDIPFAGNPLTHHYQYFAEAVDSPFPSPPPTFGWLGASVRAQQLVFDSNRLQSWQVATRVLVAESDQIVDPQRTIAWVKQHPRQELLDWEIVHEGRHELLRETGVIFKHALGQVQGWLEAACDRTS